MKVQLFGHVYSHTGPAMHAREFSKALSKMADVSINSNFPPNPQWIVEKELQPLIEKPLYDDAVRIVLEDPLSWVLHSSDKKNKLIGVMIHEGTSIPYHYAIAIIDSGVDEVWTCSEHSKNSIITGMKEFDFTIADDNIKIIPHGYNSDFYHEGGKKKLFGHGDDCFTFLYVGGWSQGTRDRKGLDVLYKAFVEEFGKNEKVRLIVKITSIYNHPDYNPLEELKKIASPGDAAPMIVIGDDFADLNELAELYRSASVFVMPTKADGFNIPGLEALACGVPVLASDYGGQTDYLNDSNSWLLSEGTFDWATDANKPLYDWAKWKTPSVKELREKMRYLFEHQEEVNKKAKASADSVSNWTWDDSAKKAMEYLNTISSK